MARLLGQFLLLRGEQCGCGSYHGSPPNLQFVPKMHEDDVELERDGEYPGKDGKARKISGVMGDEEGFLSWLMTQEIPVAMQDDVMDGKMDEDDEEREPVPAMQGLEIAMQEAYYCGTRDARQVGERKREELETRFGDALRAKHKELDKANTCVANAEATIAELRAQLAAMQAPAAAQTATPEPTTPAEPQPTAVPEPTTGEGHPATTEPAPANGQNSNP